MQELGCVLLSQLPELLISFSRAFANATIREHTGRCTTVAFLRLLSKAAKLYGSRCRRQNPPTVGLYHFRVRTTASKYFYLQTRFW